MYRVLSFSALSVSVKFLVGFLLTKIFAVFLGPNGISVIGNIKNFVQALVSVQTLGMQKGIIRYTAEYKNDKVKLKYLIGTLNRFNICVSFLLFLALLIFSKDFSVYVFNDQAYGFVFNILAFVVLFQGFHYLFFTLLQGFGDYQKVIYLEISINIASLLLTAGLVYFNGLLGGIYAVVLVPFFYFVISHFFYGSFPFFQFHFSKVISRNLLLYAAMVLFSSIAFPLIFIFIRNQITEVLNAESAGYWEAVNQFSYFYFVVLNSIMLIYFLPRISENDSLEFYREQVVEYFKILMPLYAVSLVVLYGFRNEAINLVLSPSFSAIEKLFFWQLLGDFFRAGTLVFVIFFHARRMILRFLITDLVFATLLVFLSFYFLEREGLLGVVKAHFYSYFIYFIVVFSFVSKFLFCKAK